MSPSTAAKPAANPRQPLSLRELFCLTTLAAMTVALVLYREWTDHERWLLGLTLGGTLLGILAARLFGRRAFSAGVLSGIAGSGSAVALMFREWYLLYSTPASPSPWSRTDIDPVEYAWEYFTAGAVTLCLGFCLTLLCIGSFHLVRWSTDASEFGLIRIARRHSLRAVLIVSGIAVGLAAVVQVDFLLRPGAWSPRYSISFPRSWGDQFFRQSAAVTLSHDGTWLAFRVDDARHKEGRLYRLQGQLESVKLPGNSSASGLWAQPRFSCDDERFAYLAEQHDPETGQSLHSRVQIFDLVSLTDTALQVDLPGNSIHGLTWLPGRKLVLNVDEYGYSIATDHGDHWSWEVRDKEASFEPRLGYVVYGDLELRRLVTLASSDEVASWQHDGGWELRSPDARFGLTAHELHDHKTETMRAWEADGSVETMQFYTFTKCGLAVGARVGPIEITTEQLRWLADVPFYSRIEGWLLRVPVCLLDPATGEEVARTQPLWSEPDDIAFSFDGSRMAVINLEGVYIYDVPAEFR